MLPLHKRETHGNYSLIDRTYARLDCPDYGHYPYLPRERQLSETILGYHCYRHRVDVHLGKYRMADNCHRHAGL